MVLKLLLYPTPESSVRFLSYMGVQNPQPPQTHDLTIRRPTAWSGLRNLKLKVQLKTNTASHGCDKSAQGMAYLFRPLLKLCFYLFAPSTILSLDASHCFVFHRLFWGSKAALLKQMVLKLGGAEISPAILWYTCE